MMIALKSKFADRIEDMIAYKKGIGYSESSYRWYLSNFDRYCAETFPEESELTQEVVMDWCRKRDGESINSFNRRLAAIREFGRYLRSIGISAYIMPHKMSAPPTRYVPHIYTEQELSSFFYGADHIGKIVGDPLCPYIIPVIFRLIYCCGLRPGEGLKIKNEDIDLKSGRIFIRQAKRHKDRVVMLAPDVLQLCIAYDKVRAAYSFSEYFFPDRHGNIHGKQWLSHYFRKCWKIAGITDFELPKPRIYDFRHTFATRCLHDWMDGNTDLYKMLPYLSAYMGHSDFSCTAYYIHLLPQRLKNSPALDWASWENLLPEVLS
jgi:integrase